MAIADDNLIRLLLLTTVPSTYTCHHTFVRCESFHCVAQARWFGLHTVANAVIVVLCSKDLYYVVTDPVNTLLISEMNPWPMSLVLMIHMYVPIFSWRQYC